MRRLLCAVLIFAVIFLSGCQGGTSPPTPMTDGIDCVITAEGDGGTQILRVSRSGENYDAQFLRNDGIKGLGVIISPAGCFLKVLNSQKQIDIALISNSLPVLIYTALTHDYSSDSFSDGCYASTDDCGDFKLWADDNGLISSIHFTDYNYKLTFDYKTA